MVYHIRNNITHAMDEYLIPCYHNNEFAHLLKTYLWDADIDNLGDSLTGIVAFRVPGATRGHISIKLGVVKDIVFYEDTCFSYNIGCYERDIINIKSNFINKPFDTNYEKQKG